MADERLTVEAAAGGTTPETGRPVEMTREASSSMEVAGTAAAAATSLWWRDALIISAFTICILVLGVIGIGCILKAPAEWQITKDVVGIVGNLGGALLTGYFALQVGSRK